MMYTDDAAQSRSVDTRMDRFSSDAAAAGAVRTVPPAGDVADEAHSGRHGTKLQASSRLICCLCAQCSCCLALVVASCVVGIMFRSPDLVTSFAAFTEADTPAYYIESGLTAAKKSREAQAGRRLQESRRLAEKLYRPFDLEIVYAVREESTVGNLMDVNVLSAIRRFEDNLKNSPQWQDLCDNHVEPEDKGLCDPGISLSRYVAPALTYQSANDIVPTGLAYDKDSREPLPLDAALHLAQRAEIEQYVLPEDSQELKNMASKLRTVFRFNFLCCTSTATPTEQRAWLSGINRKWDELLSETVFPYMEESSPEAAPDESYGLLVAFDGSGVRSRKIWAVILNDLYLAAGSMLFVLFYIMFHTRSICLSLTAICVVFLPIPLAYLCFAFVADSVEMNIASLLSLFLIVGLGSDVIFVYTDFWQDSRHMQGVYERYTHTVKYAGKATLATTIATALSFFANLASVLRPLREFGFFMGMCVLFVWVLVPFIYLPVCVFDELWFSRYRLDQFRCCQKDDTKRRLPGTSKERFVNRYIVHLFKFRCCYLCLPTLLLVILGIIAVTAAKASTEVPGLLPDGHEVEVQDQLVANFQSVRTEIIEPIPTGDAVCNLADFRAPCRTMYWCEAVTKDDVEGDSCWSMIEERAGTCYQSFVPIKHRIVNARDLGDPELWLLSNATLASQPAEFPSSSRLTYMNAKSVSPLIAHDWLAGDTDFMQLQEVDTILRQDENATSCGFDIVMFCGKIGCRLDGGWTSSMPARLGHRSGRRLDEHPEMVRRTLKATEPAAVEAIGVLPASGHPSSRRLLSTTLNLNKQTRIDVAFGILVAQGSPRLGKRDADSAWEFNTNMEMADPWAQRNLYQFCNINTMQEWGLLIAESTCWIRVFEEWLRSMQLRASNPQLYRFPVRRESFHPLVRQFASVAKVKLIGHSGLSTSVDNYLWLKNGELKASYMAFLSYVDYTTSGASANAYKKRWDDYLMRFVPPGLDGVPSALHSSNLWVAAAAQDELRDNFFVTLAVVVTLAFAAMLVFTESPVLSTTVVLCTLTVLCGLAFVIIVIMQLAIGPVEAIALIVFIGYSVTYSLHIAHHYGDHNAVLEMSHEPSIMSDLTDRQRVRFSRTLYATRCIAAGITGSAVTTLGCSFFLVLCTIPIFRKLGLVAIAVTILSILVSLVTLPAGLMMMGPMSPGQPPPIAYRLCPWLERCTRHGRRKRSKERSSQDVTGASNSREVDNLTSVKVESDPEDAGQTKFSI